MQVYKFGGASIATPNKALGLLPIIKAATPPLAIVVSALGKTTNALEQAVSMAIGGNKSGAIALAQAQIAAHLSYAQNLLSPSFFAKAVTQLQPFFQELLAAVEQAKPDQYDYWYDQVVCLGELLATTIISCMLDEHQYACAWLDARTLIRTDDTYRDAAIDWESTTNNVAQFAMPLLAAGGSIITQGFIGASATGASTTLGREGSDYTAAVLAAMLQGSSLTIWKDVEGLLNADPKMFADTVRIPAISYNEVIEMAFYGAQIIHPKTIKPLQNNNIPLLVKSFVDSNLPGTIVCAEVNDASYPPLIVRKDNQVLLQVTTRDFSFITESNLSLIYAAFHQLKVRVNLIQNAAISFTACIDNRPEKVAALIQELGTQYQVRQNEMVSLLTIRHYKPDTCAQHTAGAQILLKQETRKTIQAVIKYE